MRSSWRRSGCGQASSGHGAMSTSRRVVTAVASWSVSQGWEVRCRSRCMDGASVGGLTTHPSWPRGSGDGGTRAPARPEVQGQSHPGPCGRVRESSAGPRTVPTDGGHAGTVRACRAHRCWAGVRRCSGVDAVMARHRQPEPAQVPVGCGLARRVSAGASRSVGDNGRRVLRLRQ